MAVKSAVYDYSLYTPDYYLKGFLAGGVPRDYAAVRVAARRRRVKRSLAARAARAANAAERLCTCAERCEQSAANNFSPVTRKSARNRSASRLRFFCRASGM